MTDLAGAVIGFLLVIPSDVIKAGKSTMTP
jgi:hypothetical protein